MRSMSTAVSLSGSETESSCQWDDAEPEADSLMESAETSSSRETRVDPEPTPMPSPATRELQKPLKLAPMKGKKRGKKGKGRKSKKTKRGKNSKRNKTRSSGQAGTRNGDKAATKVVHRTCGTRTLYRGRLRLR